MNLMTFLNRGADHANILAHREKQRLQQLEHDALEDARTMWLDRLLVDETRAWMEIGTEAREAVTGLSTLLTMAGMASVYDAGNVGTPAVSTIRGALSAMDQCVNAEGAIMSAEHARALSVAAGHARNVLKGCTRNAIAHAALSMKRLADGKLL